MCRRSVSLLTLAAAAALCLAAPLQGDSSSSGVRSRGGLNLLRNSYSVNWLNLPLSKRDSVTLRAPVRVKSYPGKATSIGSHPIVSGGTGHVPVKNPDHYAPVPTAAVGTPSRPLVAKVDVQLPYAAAVKTAVLLSTFEASQALGKPPLQSAATGVASVTVSAPSLPGGAYILTIEAQMLGLTHVPFAATLNGPAFIGQKGQALFKLSPLLNGTYSIPVSLFRLMSGGQAYIAVRTKKYPEGELRGQLCFENCALAVATGWQQVGIVRSPAYAVSQVLLDQRTGALVVATVKSHGKFTSPVTGVELRFGAPGITTAKTPIICPIVGAPPSGYPTDDDSSSSSSTTRKAYSGYAYAGKYTSPAGSHVAAHPVPLAFDAVDVNLFVCPSRLSRDNVRQLRAGLFFLNIRTFTHPEGEIRGQLVSPARLNVRSLLAAWLQGQERSITQNVPEQRVVPYVTNVPVQVPVQVQVKVPYKVKVASGHDDSSSSSSGRGGLRGPARPSYVTHYKTELRTELRTVLQPQTLERTVTVQVPVTRVLRSRGRGWELNAPLTLNSGWFVSQLSLRALSGKVLATEIRAGRHTGAATPASNGSVIIPGTVLAPLPPFGPYAWHVFATGRNPSAIVGEPAGPVSPFPIEASPVPNSPGAPVVPDDYNDWSNSNPIVAPPDAQEATRVKYSHKGDDSSATDGRAATYGAYGEDDSSGGSAGPLPAAGHTYSKTYIAPRSYRQENIYDELVSGTALKTVRTTSFPLFDLDLTTSTAVSQAGAGGGNGGGVFPAVPAQQSALGELIGVITPRSGPDAVLVKSPTPPEQGKPPVGSPVPKKGVIIHSPLYANPDESSSSSAPAPHDNSHGDSGAADYAPYVPADSEGLSEGDIAASAHDGAADGLGAEADGLVDPSGEAEGEEDTQADAAAFEA